MRARQRKEAKIEDLKKWYYNYRELCIRTGYGTDFDQKGGYFKPEQRLNVDQSPLPFVIDVKKT